MLDRDSGSGYKKQGATSKAVASGAFNMQKRPNTPYRNSTQPQSSKAVASGAFEMQGRPNTPYRNALAKRLRSK